MGIATRWSNVLRTGSVETKFVAVDFGTLMFTMEKGRDILEVGWCFLPLDRSFNQCSVPILLSLYRTGIYKLLVLI